MGDARSSSESALSWWKQVTLMTRVDQLAQTNPQRVYASFPNSPLTYDKGFREVTYAELANAINGVAWFLEKNLGRGEKQETLAYIGPNDVRYTALILGAAKAGYVMLLTSPRNSLAAHRSLLTVTGCKTVLSPFPQPPQITAIVDAIEVECLHVPNLKDLLDKPHPIYPYTKTFEEARLDTLFTVHTSGSTGIPKPLAWNHQCASTNIEHMSLDPPSGYESQDRMMQKNRVFLTFPPFHLASLASLLLNGIVHGTVMIVPASGIIPSGQGLVDAMKQTKIDVGFLIPSIVLDLVQSPENLDFVSKNLSKILYCGGDLPQAIGDMISAKVPLYNQYGASEMGITPQVIRNRRSRDDWKYITPHPEISAEFRHAGGSLYEYIIVRKPEGQEQPACFSIFPNLDVYPSKDLMERHPTEPDMWKWRARVDDVLVFLNGEKTNPITMEQHIVAQNADVAYALVAGAQRFQASLLIQPRDYSKIATVAQREAFIESIWSSVEEANRECPAHARIAKSHVLFTTSDKPMSLTPKGTVQRLGTVTAYEQELQMLYENVDSSVEADKGKILAVQKAGGVEAISDLMKEAVLATSEIKNLGMEDNFFTLGMDSLQALLMLRRLRHSLGISSTALSTVYANPSVKSLTQALLGQAKNENSQHLESESREAAIVAAVQKYQAMIDTLPIQSPSVKTERDVSVILTGSTGAICSHILLTLLANPAVSKIYCLNRTEDSRQLQASRNKLRGLHMELDDPRLSFHKVELSHQSLGLSDTVYTELKENVTHIVHAAWPVDFNLPLSAFESHLQGVVNLLSLAASSARHVSFLYLSSISAVMSYATDTHTVPEEPIASPSAPSPQGYGQSKFVSEQLMVHASKRLSSSSVSLAFARVGQVAGATGQDTATAAGQAGPQEIGKSIVTWNTAEWFPSMVISSLHIEAIPDTLGPAMGRIDWVPIDVLGQVLSEQVLALSSTSTPTKPSDETDDRSTVQVLHPQNPEPTTWAHIQPVVIDEIRQLTGKSLQVVPLNSWLNKVHRAIEIDAAAAPRPSDSDLAALLKLNPAVKLLEWYRDTLGAGEAKDAKDAQDEKGGKEEDKVNVKVQHILETKKTSARSEKLRSLGGVQPAWVRKWVGEWVGSIQ